MEWKSKLSAFAKRVRMMRTLKFGAIGATCGAACSLVLALLDWVGVFYTTPLTLGSVVAFGLLAGALLGWCLKSDLNQLADSIDRRAGLGNRLRTALEHQDSEMAVPQSADALDHLKNVKPSEAFPFRRSKWHTAFVTLSVLTAALFLLGNTPIFLSKEAQAERKEVIQKGTELVKLAKPILEKPDGDLDAEAKKLANKIEKAGRDMQTGRMSKEEALKKHNELAQEARKLEQERNNESKTALKSSQESLKNIAMRKAAKEMGLDRSDFKSLQNRELESLSDEEIDAQSKDVSQDLENLQSQLDSGKGKSGEKLTKEEMEALKQQQKQLEQLKLQFEFSKKVRDFLKRIQNMPEFKEYMEAVKKLLETQEKSDAGKLDQPQKTKKELEELRRRLLQDAKDLQKRLEKMSDSMSDEDIKNMIQDMIEALKKGCGT